MSGSQQPKHAPSPSSSRRRPERPSLSCTECRRRKQKCNQGKPCTNCSRRFPQPICEYDTKVTKKPKKPGNPVEDPALGVTDNRGPYSHLRYTGIQDAILQIELPTRFANRDSKADSSSWDPDSPMPASGNGNDSPDTWRRFTLFAQDQQYTLASKIINDAVRKAVQQRCESRTPANEDRWAVGATEIIRAAEEALPPSKPVSGTFDDLRHLPMAPTRLNKELVRTHLQLLCRFKVSVNGTPAPDNAFMRHWVPFTVQDPLLLQVVLYTASCFLKETGHVPKTLTLAYKGRVYQALNTNLRAEETQCDDATVLAVAQLIVDEWYWGATTDLRAHMHGLQMLIRMRDGLQNLGMHGFLAKMILLNDVGIALTHETQPMIFDQPGFEFADPVMVPFQTSLNTPFVSGWPTFTNSTLSTRLHPTTAAILDDMRNLIETVLNDLDEDLNHIHPEKIAVNVAWFQQRLHALPEEVFQQATQSFGNASEERTPSSSPAVDSRASSTSSPPEQVTRDHGMGAPDAVYRMVRMTALLYCRAIANRQPLSETCTEAEYQNLWPLSWQIQRGSLQTSVGVLFWAITAIAPSCPAQPTARFMKTIMICGLMNMGVDNWHVATDAARRAIKLQAWLRGSASRGLAVYGGGQIVEKHGFALKDRLPHVGLTPHYEDGEAHAEDKGG